MTTGTTIAYLIAAFLLVALNGFFVAAEFALIKLRTIQVETMVKHGRPFARQVRWLHERLDEAISVCQLGITMASLALGWVGEPAFAHLLEPLLEKIGIASPALVHTIALVTSFTVITVLHIVIGEQVPKIYAIRRPAIISLWLAWPLKFFYFLTFPLMKGLNGATSFLLRRLGLTGSSGHDQPASEEEIRALVVRSHDHGHLSRAEHALINAVFDFDEQLSRTIMVPRAEVVALAIGAPLGRWLEEIAASRHSRYPVVEGSLDQVLGILHVKELVGLPSDAAPETLRALLREPLRIPETMPISQLLRLFQRSRQHVALVIDEFGNLIGMVTLENVLEQIVGPVEDEFDQERPEIEEEGPGSWVVYGGASIAAVNERLGLVLVAGDVSTLSGLLVARSGRLPAAGDTVELEGVVAEVLEAEKGRALRVRLTVPPVVAEPAAETTG